MFFEFETCNSSREQFHAMNLPATPASKTLFVLLSFAAIGLSFPGCVKRSRESRLSNPVRAALPTQDQAVSLTPAIRRININTASARDIENLPGIGPGLAARIVEHREKNGRFRRPEHLIMVRGISDKRFRALRDMVTVE